MHLSHFVTFIFFPSYLFRYFSEKELNPPQYKPQFSDPNILMASTEHSSFLLFFPVIPDHRASMKQLQHTLLRTRDLCSHHVFPSFLASLCSFSLLFMVFLFSGLGDSKTKFLYQWHPGFSREYARFTSTSSSWFEWQWFPLLFASKDLGDDIWLEDLKQSFDKDLQALGYLSGDIPGFAPVQQQRCFYIGPRYLELGQIEISLALHSG